ncbi:MAG: hypothetical protein AABN34_18365, partial [Acidobacteriota bacterium]
MSKKILTGIVVVLSFVVGAWSASGSANIALPPGYKMVLVSWGNVSSQDAKNGCDNQCHFNGKWCPGGTWHCETIDPALGVRQICIKLARSLFLSN